MKRFLTLMQREWLQHRIGWAMAASIPFSLTLLAAAFGQVQLDGETLERVGNGFPALLAAGSIAFMAALLFVIECIAALIMVSSLSRRDHADRSVEFWLSVPATHSESFAAPLLVHLILAPAAALCVGLLGGYVVSLVLVTRMAGFGEWLALPWGGIVAASLALTGRLLAGLPLAVLWLAPLILAVVLTTAWLRKWGWVVLAVGVGLGSQLLKYLLGQPLLSEAINGLLRHAGQALVTGRHSMMPRGAGPDASFEALHAVPGWALGDLTLALRDLASPLLAGGLVFAAACFALLVLWRQRGAGTAG